MTIESDLLLTHPSGSLHITTPDQNTIQFDFSNRQTARAFFKVGKLPAIKSKLESVFSFLGNNGYHLDICIDGKKVIRMSDSWWSKVLRFFWLRLF